MIESAVLVKNLTKVFDKTVHALDGVDLEIGAGKIFALLGPNGSGKTTLMRILTTQINSNSGEAYVFGLNVAKDGTKIRKMITYVPQEMSIWGDITGYENLLIYSKIYGIPSSTRKKLISEALEDMGLTEYSKKIAKTYSGGMIRRLELACAILSKPRLMFLDEPTIGLDPSARKAVWEKILGFKKDFGITVFFNTHYMDEADLYSDEISIINRGKIVKSGVSEDLKHSIGYDSICFGFSRTSWDPKINEEIKELGAGYQIIESDAQIIGRLENMEIKITTPNADENLPDILNVFTSHKVKLSKISVTKPTLEDVFMKYAGARFDTGQAMKDAKHVRDRIVKG
jgi:ABC-2 type transport system ATP-binding protein